MHEIFSSSWMIVDIKLKRWVDNTLFRKHIERKYAYFSQKILYIIKRLLQVSGKHISWSFVCLFFFFSPKATGYFSYLHHRKLRNYKKRLALIWLSLHSSKRADNCCLKFVSGNHLGKDNEFEILLFLKSPSKTCLIYVQEQFKCITLFF